MWNLSCSMQDLALGRGTKPGPLALGAKSQPLDTREVPEETLSFWGRGPKRGMAHKDCRMQSNVIYVEKKDLLPRRHWIIFSKGWAEPNPVRNQNLCHQCQGGVKLQLALRLPSLTILRLCRLPPLLPPPVSDSSCRSLDASPCVQLSCCSTFKVLYFKIKNVFFIFVFVFLCIICEKYYKPIMVQYYTATCVSYLVS